MTHDGFLQAITDCPDDDDVRLIYADWLDDHGAADRAEFIRAQCQLARGVTGPRRAALETRQRQLRQRHEGEWVRPIRHLLDGWEFRRGFVAEVRVEARTFVREADAIFQAAPVQHLQLYWGAVAPADRARFVPVLAECVHLGRLHSLDLSHNYLGSVGVQALAVCAHLGQLSELNLANNHIGDAGARALAGSPLLRQLRRLDLSGNDLGPTGVRHLSSALQGLLAVDDRPALLALDLRGNRLGQAGLREVINCPVLRRIAEV